MTNQKYRDFTLVLGAPSGNRYEMLCSIADQTERSFSDVYFEYLTDVFKPRNKRNIIDETLSVLLDEEIHAGECQKSFPFFFSGLDENVINFLLFTLLSL